MQSGEVHLPGATGPTELRLRDEGAMDVVGGGVAVVDPLEPEGRIVVPFPDGTHRIVATCVIRPGASEPELAYVSVIARDAVEKERVDVGRSSDRGSSEGDRSVVSTGGSLIALADAQTAGAWTKEAARGEAYARWHEDVESDFGGTQHVERADLPAPLRGSVRLVPSSFLRVSRGLTADGATAAVHLDLETAWEQAQPSSAQRTEPAEEELRREAARKERLSVILIVVTLAVLVGFVLLAKQMGW